MQSSAVPASQLRDGHHLALRARRRRERRVSRCSAVSEARRCLLRALSTERRAARCSGRDAAFYEYELCPSRGAPPRSSAVSEAKRCLLRALSIAASCRSCGHAESMTNWFVDVQVYCVQKFHDISVILFGFT